VRLGDVVERLGVLGGGFPSCPRKGRVVAAEAGAAGGEAAVVTGRS